MVIIILRILGKFFFAHSLSLCFFYHVHCLLVSSVSYLLCYIMKLPWSTFTNYDFRALILFVNGMARTAKIILFFTVIALKGQC